jgi:hypothetical protein
MKTHTTCKNRQATFRKDLDLKKVQECLGQPRKLGRETAASAPDQNSPHTGKEFATRSYPTRTVSVRLRKPAFAFFAEKLICTASRRELKFERRKRFIRKRRKEETSVSFFSTHRKRNVRTNAYIVL